MSFLFRQRSIMTSFPGVVLYISFRWEQFIKYMTDIESFLAHSTNGRAYSTVFIVCLSPSVTLCIVAKRCVLEQTLLPIGSRI